MHGDRLRFFFRLILINLICFNLFSCMVGPNWHPPVTPLIRDYAEKPLPRKTTSIRDLGSAGRAQYYRVGMDLPGEWWRLFHSPVLNELIRIGLLNSPNLAAARATLCQAIEAVNVQIGNSLFPAFDANFTASRQRVGAVGGAAAGSAVAGGNNNRAIAGRATGANVTNNIFNLFNANVSVSYTLDIFGGARREIESLIAQADYQRYQLLGAYLTLTSNIATTAINIASFRAQIATTISLIKAERNQLHILNEQYRLGAVSQADVLTQETLVEQTAATLPPLQLSLSTSLHQMDVLVGRFPDRYIPPIDLDKLVLPKNIPVSLPSSIVCQRPDVQAAIALLHSANAQVGVANANLLPQFTITGSYGWQALVASSLFHPANKVWNIAAGIAQPLFHGGALLASRRQALAAYQQAGAQYRETLLTAFQNVADSLKALETDARALKALKKAEDAANKSLKMVQQQYLLGGANYLSLLIAQQKYQESVINRIRAQGDRYADTVALFQSLGGGWWNLENGCGC